MRAFRTWIREHSLLSVLIGLAILVSAMALIIRARTRDLGALTDPLRRGPVIESVYGIGTVTARRIFHLKLGVTSTVRELFVMEGDSVRKGQRLLTLDGTGTPVAPFGGTITFLPVKVSETVFSQASILELVDLSDRYVVVSLEQRGAIRVRPDQEARLSFDSMRESVFLGRVESVYSHETNFLVRIRADDLPPQILPGMTADVAILIGRRENALLVPAAAIDAGRVYVKRSARRPRAVEVRTGIVDGEFAELVSGDVHEGDRLVIRKKVAR